MNGLQNGSCLDGDFIGGDGDFMFTSESVGEGHPGQKNRPTVHPAGAAEALEMHE